MNRELPIEVQGLWWLPEDPEHRVSGWLTYTAETGGELRLAGALRREVWQEEVLPDGTVQRVQTYDSRAEREQNIYPRIHGRSGRTLYNLEDCFRVQKQVHYPREYITEKVHVNNFLRGALFEAGDSAPAFDRCVVQLRHLTAWVGLSGLSSQDLPFPPEPNQPFLLLRADDIPALTSSLDDGELLLTQSLRQTGDHLHDIGVVQEWSLRLNYPSTRPLDEFVDAVSDAQDLISIAAGKTSDIDYFALEHPEIGLTSLDGKASGSHRAQVDYFAQWSNRSRDIEQVAPIQMYFRLKDFGGVEGLGRWLNMAPNYRTELGRVMATRYSREMYLEDRIMNCCAALESLDKVRRGTGKSKIDFIDRIRECVDLAGGPFAALIAEGCDSWAKTVKDCRHDLAHHRERLRTNTTAAEHLLSEQLFWLFVLCMLRLAQAPDVTFDSIERHRHFKWLSEQARDAVGDAS